MACSTYGYRLRLSATAVLLATLACNAPLNPLPSADQPGASAVLSPSGSPTVASRRSPAAADTPAPEEGSGVRGTASEKSAIAAVGRTIPGLEITFVSQDGTVARAVTTDERGSYELVLDAGSYHVSAAHPDYDDYATAPGYWLTIAEGYRDFDLYLMPSRSADVLLITTSLLQQTSGFELAIAQYALVLADTEDLAAAYVEVDSLECLGTYGVQAPDAASWEEIRRALEAIIGMTRATYVVILGGQPAVPRPRVDACCLDETPIPVPSDAWYVDFDGDQIVDEGLSVGRLPDLLYGSETVVAALQTATGLHEAGGYTLEAQVRFTLNDYTTPPYGVCDSCTMQEEFFELMSTSDYIFFAGHGGPSGFYNNSYEPIFTISYMDSVDLRTHHPVIIGYYSCNTGVLLDESPSLAYEFLRAGSAAFVARTTTEGVPTDVADDFPEDLAAGERIGDALFTAMRETVVERGEAFQAAAGHLCLYGDPTLSSR
jgi:hypothetical protein